MFHYYLFMGRYSLYGDVKNTIHAASCLYFDYCITVRVLSYLYYYYADIRGGGQDIGMC